MYGSCFCCLTGKSNSGVKCLLVRPDFLDGTVYLKGRKTKDSNETLRAFPTMITKKIRPKEIKVDKVTKFAGEFRKL